MKSAHFLALAILALALPSAVLAQSTPGGGFQITKTFCASGCDSSATSFVIPGGASDIHADLLGPGGSGGGGFSGTSGGAGGGGAGGIFIQDRALSTGPGDTLNFTGLVAAPTGGAIGSVGAGGTGVSISWTHGAFTFTTPTAFSGCPGGVGVTTAGGPGGAEPCTTNNASAPAGGTGPAYNSLAAAAAGAPGAGANGSAQSGVGFSPFIFGASGGAGGGNATGTGGVSRLFALNGSTGNIPGGAATNTNLCGGGGAGGSSWGSLGGAGGSGGSSVGAGANSGGPGAGGGGGSCNAAGGNGGEGMITLRWTQN